MCKISFLTFFSRIISEMNQKNGKTNLKRIDIRLPGDILEEIEKIAEKEALPRSVFLRSLIVKEVRRRGDNE